MNQELHTISAWLLLKERTMLLFILQFKYPILFGLILNIILCFYKKGTYLFISSKDTGKDKENGKNHLEFNQEM